MFAESIAEVFSDSDQGRNVGVYRPQGGHSSADASATHKIDRHTAMLQRTDRANVSVTSSTTTAKDQTNGFVRDESGQTLVVGRVTDSNMMMRVYMTLAQPCSRSRRYSGAVGVEEDEFLARGTIGHCPLENSRLQFSNTWIVFRRRNDENQVGGAYTQRRPRGKTRIAFQ